jgi:hypothetical protein
MIFKKIEPERLEKFYKYYFKKLKSLKEYKVHVNNKFQYTKKFNVNSYFFCNLMYGHLKLKKIGFLIITFFKQFCLNLIDLFIEFKLHLLKNYNLFINYYKLHSFLIFFWKHKVLNNYIILNNFLNKMFYTNFSVSYVFFNCFILLKQYINMINSNLIISSNYFLKTKLEYNIPISINNFKFDLNNSDFLNVNLFRLNISFFIYNTLNKLVVEDFYTDGQDNYSMLSEIMKECSYLLQSELNNFSNL